MIKVTVIVPVYNVEGYIRKCLDSLVCQTIKEIEIICINDCSTDKSLLILEEYKKNNSNFYVYNNSFNRGLSYTRNYGISLAKGEYILFVDSDDWLIEADSIETLYSIAKNDNLDLLRYRLNTDNYSYCSDEIKRGKQCFFDLVKNESFGWESVRNFVKNDFLKTNDITFDEKIYGCEDIIFSIKCIYLSNMCKEINNTLYFYNQRDDSITHKGIDSKNIVGNLRAMKEMYLLMSGEEDFSMKCIFLNVLNRIYEICDYGLWNLKNSLDFSLFENEDLELYETLFKNGRLIVKDNIFKNWNEILNSHKVYLYGAGKAAEELLSDFGSRVTISGIMVSEKEKGLEFWNGIKVFGVGEKFLSKTGLVIIAIKGTKTHYDIIRLLKKNGFQNYLIAGKSD